MRYALALGLISLVASLTTGSARPAGQKEAPTTRVVHIAAERFSFNPSEIKVKAGTRLEFRLSSDDTGHGFHILDTDIDVEIPKRGRGTATVVFQPSPGKYTFECSRLCGAGHSFMRGVIVVTE